MTECHASADARGAAFRAVPGNDEHIAASSSSFCLTRGLGKQWCMIQGYGNNHFRHSLFIPHALNVLETTPMGRWAGGQELAAEVLSLHLAPCGEI